MKNKHLVLLFLLTVAVGWMLRKFPWKQSEVLEADLLHLDTTAIQQIIIRMPEQSDRVLGRTDTAWTLTQNAHIVRVPASNVSALLRVLSPMVADRVVHTLQPDTLGLRLDACPQLLIELANGRHENLYIGKSLEGHTFVQLPRHEGIYRVQGDLPSLLAFQLDRFRPAWVCHFEPASVQSVFLQTSDIPGWTFQFQDSTQRWQSDSLRFGVSNDSMRIWLAWVNRLNRCVFADFFDETNAEEAHVATINLSTDTAEIVLKLYYLSQPQLPDDWRRLPEKPQMQSCYVVHSSQNADNWFAVYDTLLVQRLFKRF